MNGGTVWPQAKVARSEVDKHRICDDLVRSWRETNRIRFGFVFAEVKIVVVNLRCVVGSDAPDLGAVIGEDLHACVHNKDVVANDISGLTEGEDDIGYGVFWQDTDNGVVQNGEVMALPEHEECLVVVTDVVDD